MKTEFEYGREYAEWLRDENQDGAHVVDIEKMLGGTVVIPDADYQAMCEAGIDQPNSRLYWEGFNSVFEKNNG